MQEYVKDSLKKSKPWVIGLIIFSLCAIVVEYLIGEKYQIVMVLSAIALMCGIVSSVYLIFIIVHLITLGIGKITAKIERKTKQIDKSDLENNKEYYREILETNSPLILGYLDNFELNKNKITAELLYLRMKNFIEVKNSKLEKVCNEDVINLKEGEKEIVENIIDGKLKIKEPTRLRENVASNAEKLKLVKKNQKVLNINRRGIFAIISFILGVLVAFNIFSLPKTIQDVKSGWITEIEFIFGWLAIVLSFWGLSALIVYLLVEVFKSMYIKTKGILYKRTAKGRELNQKLEGLKNYLKDYSMLDERETKEIELWDDYLIYSVMFGQNKKIIEEYEKYIEIIGE